MTTVRYKGFSILALPYRIARSRRWTVDLEIRRKGMRQAFSLEERYRTEREAEYRCTGLARRIIDGGVPRMSVDHLREIPAWHGPFAWLRSIVALLTHSIGAPNRA